MREKNWWLTGRCYLCLRELLEIFPFHRNYPSNHTDTCRTQPLHIKTALIMSFSLSSKLTMNYFGSSVFFCQKINDPFEETEARTAFRQHLLALGQAALIAVTRSSVHASACKRHGHLGLNGCRCERQAWHHDIITSQIKHNTTSQYHNTHIVTWHWHTDIMRLFLHAYYNMWSHHRRASLTCITFILIEGQKSGPLRTGTGEPTRTQQTQMTAHVLTRIQHCTKQREEREKWETEIKKMINHIFNSKNTGQYSNKMKWFLFENI